MRAPRGGRRVVTRREARHGQGITPAEGHARSEPAGRAAARLHAVDERRSGLTAARANGVQAARDGAAAAELSRAEAPGPRDGNRPPSHREG